jgi:hypothetical protein
MCFLTQSKAVFAERLKPEKKRRKIKEMAISSPELFVGTLITTCSRQEVVN